MQIIKHNPTGLFPQYRCYTHAVEVPGDSRLLIISGLNGYLKDGKTMPESFEEQADIIWTHIGTLLRSAGMEFTNLVSLRTYLADPEYDEANVRMRVKYLGDHETSSTVVCCRLLDPKWKVEIEAMAAGRDRAAPPPPTLPSKSSLKSLFDVLLRTFVGISLGSRVPLAVVGGATGSAPGQKRTSGYRLH